jgi:hypothetical protein
VDVASYDGDTLLGTVTVAVSGALDALDLAARLGQGAGAPLEAHLRHDGRLVLARKAAFAGNGFRIGGSAAAALGFADGTTVVCLEKRHDGASYNQANDGDPNANGGAGEKDDVQGSVENVTGTDFSDELVGNAGANTLNGGKGNDALASVPNAPAAMSLAGGDLFSGGDGDDLLDAGFGMNAFATYNGGNGSDTVDFRKRRGSVTVDVKDTKTSPGDGESGESAIVMPNVETVLKRP